MSRRFYDRVSTKHVDGSAIFRNEEDVRSEREIADALEEAWGCLIHNYAPLTPIDFWIERDKRVVGFAEVKARDHDINKFATVFLSHRKWLALSLSQMAGPKSVFVVRFIGGEIRWIMLNDIDPSKIARGGWWVNEERHRDIEPVIEVPIASMKGIA